ncbi:hypothetical protein [Dictyobacter kobayashii]|uniref:Uncharacterized protein n=1 Tax=Dictyobacter kobayashii TaxID=2014872 RepID=A0A402AHV2_9CHLR|nr:hypothetical protein [Dictyobacter kobayashii]GCE18635.1 hypothetical protein KDK_24350 [Dictyobacter kobayashii]
MEQEQLMPDREAMIRFLDWVKVQSEEVFVMVLSHVATIQSVLAGSMLCGIQTPTQQFACPDYWSMQDSASALRDFAQEQGFADAAHFCEVTRQLAEDHILAFEEIVQQ